MTRRHDLDALRVFAFALLILYHGAMLYVAEWDWHVKSSYLAEWLQWPMLAMNRWRMALLFLVSGLAVGFVLPRQRRSGFIWNRTRRILLPLLFGMAVIVPVQAYCQGVSNGLVEPGFGAFLWRYLQHSQWPAGAFDGWEHGVTWNHLWYLAYIWVYSLLLAALRPLLDGTIGQRLQTWLGQLRGWRLLLLPALPLVLYCTVLLPRFEETHDLLSDWFLHAQFFTIFLYGYLLAGAKGFWAELLRIRRPLAVTALVLVAVYVSILKLAGEDWSEPALTAVRSLRGVLVWATLLAILGWGYACLNRPFRWLPYANEAVLPWYMLHQSLTVLLSYWLVPLKVGPVIEPLLVIGGTVAGCLLIHEGLIRRTPWLRPLFGLAPLKPSAEGSRAVAATCR